ncbi:MAG: signal recognition particle protein, partial [Candidatus Kuenenia sp.]|nr:signal recognition particle protein [Candidatus Kuenenia sp.]
KMDGLNFDEKQLEKVEAIIKSMTIQERLIPDMINGSRRQRVAKGSGTTVQDVNQLLKQFKSMKKLMKHFKGNEKGLKKKGMFPGGMPFGKGMIR